MKQCALCLNWKPLDKFHQCKDGRHSYCKRCDNERAKEWYAANREKGNAKRKQWYADNSEKAKAQAKARYHTLDKKELAAKKRAYRRRKKDGG